MSDTLAQQALDAYTQTKSDAEAGKLLQLPEQTARNRRREAQNRGMKPSGQVILLPENDLKRQIARLENELKAASKRVLDEDAIRREVIKLSATVETLQAPGWVLADPKSPSSPGVPTLFLSDLHWGEVVAPSQINHVNEFNLKIARERMRTTIDMAVHLLKIISPKMDYPGIVLALGGDMISGNIHDELSATNELNTMPTVVDLYGELVGVIEGLAGKFGRVFLPCVTGNHGRDTRKIWGKDRHATSFDWLLYVFLAKHFANDPRITFYIPDGPDAYYRVFSHRYLLTHGDQFRGGDGVIGALGPIIRGDHRKRSRNGQIDMAYDTMLIGHWHQLIQLTRLIVNGSMKGYDEYGYSNNFGFERPQQALWLTHPNHGITFSMPVHCDRQKHAPKTNWVAVAA